MDTPRRYLEDEKFEIEWTIQDFKALMDIADKCGSTKAMQIETDFSQKRYDASDNLEVENRWVFFLRKPKVGGGSNCSLGVKRDVLNFHEGHEAETPFGVKVSFRIGDPIQNVFTSESEVFYMKHGEMKKWDAGARRTLLEAAQFELLTIYVTLQIFANEWRTPSTVKDLEESTSLKEEARHTRAALSSFFARPELPFADFSLKVVDGDKTFRVNKCIVGAISPVFKRMFSNPMFIEGQQESMTIVDMTADAVQHLLAFIYGGAMTLSAHKSRREANAEIIMQLVDAAEKYEIPSLKTLCDQKLEQFFTPRNAYEMLDLCDTHDLAISAPKIDKYFEDNMLFILETKRNHIQIAAMSEQRTGATCSD